MEMHRIRIQWGYWMFYVPYPFQHAEYRWDGAARVHGGKITKCWSIDFNGTYGDIREHITPLAEPRWYWQNDYTQNRMGGVLLEIEGGPDCRVEIITRTAELRFTVRDLKRQRLIKTHVGPRYSNVDISAFFDEDDPNLDTMEDIEALSAADGLWRGLVLAKDFSGPVHRWYRIDLAWAFPGKSVEADLPRNFVKQVPLRDRQSTLVALIRLSAAAVGKDETLEQVLERGGGLRPGNAGNVDDLPYVIELNNVEIARGTQTFRHHGVLQFEELEIVLPNRLYSAAGNTLKITNLDTRNHLVIARILFEERVIKDLEMPVCPAWVVRGQEFEIELLCRREQAGVTPHLPQGVTLLDSVAETMSKGRHRLRLRADEPLADFFISFSSSGGECTGHIEQVISCSLESRPMLVGLEDGMFPEDVVGFREEVLRHFANNRIGNVLVCRGFHKRERALEVAEVCKRYGIRLQVASQFNPQWAKELRDLLGPLFDGYYWSEFDGFLWGYAVMPHRLPSNIPEDGRTMRTAYEQFLAYMRGLIAWVREADPDMPNLALMSNVGQNYACEAGMSSTLSQFNKSNNALLVADARGALRAYRRPFWGTYQAEGAHVSPEGPHHLRMWRLALHLAYVAGASQVNDEEALYRTHHQRVYARGDRVPRLRKEILKEFYRYANAHPRRGKLKTRQACLVGRYACDVSDGISRADEYGRGGGLPLVWRTFGGRGPEWRPLTPEYGMRYLDVFLPGVWLTNLEQYPETVRRWYCGTPLGEIELTSIDAPQEVLSEYPLLLILGWNTMDEIQYCNLRSYVEKGGRLFMSVAHATCNESRRFLEENMEPVNLLRKGDFRDLFGVAVKGRGAPLGRIQGDPAVEGNPVGDFIQLPTRCSSPPVIPQHPPVDLAEVDVQGAEVLATDIETGAPVLVRRRLGKGEAYLLCAYDYPGNSRLVPFVKPLIRELAQSTPWPVELDDLSGDVYYTVREEEASDALTVHLLNTDWTEEGNEKPCRLRLGDSWIDVTVEEGRISVVYRRDRLALLIEDDNVHVVSIRQEDGTFVAELHGHGKAEIKLRALEGRIISAAFRGVNAPLRLQEDWRAVCISFGPRSVGELSVHLDDR